MKNYLTSKLIFVSYVALLWTASFVHIDAESQTAHQLKTEDAIVQTAIRNFKEILAQKEGHVNRLSCTVKMNNGKAVETVTKAYYSTYHQKPDCSIVCHSDEQPTRTVEVIFNKTNSSTFFLKENGTKKQIPVPSGFRI